MKMAQYLRSPLLAGGATVVRPPVFDGLYSYEKVMLMCGVILFLILAFGLVVFLIKGKSTAPLLPFLLVSVVMIGFPAVQKINFDKASAELERQQLAVEQRPNDAMAREALAKTVEKVAIRPSEDPRVLLRLATANEALGRREQAAVQLDRALQIRPDLPEAVEMRARLQPYRGTTPVRPGPGVIEPNR